MINSKERKEDKIMARLTRLQRSQNAHSVLRMKHADTPGKRGDVLYRYHNNVLQMQKAKKRILTKTEKRKVYTTVRKRVYR